MDSNLKLILHSQAKHQCSLPLFVTIKHKNWHNYTHTDKDGSHPIVHDTHVLEYKVFELRAGVEFNTLARYLSILKNKQLSS